tara:strand:- start:104 stop:679 length:576 start_codon:yes stop_codon:yes gene_type:complete
MMVENIPVCGSVFPAEQSTNTDRKTKSLRFNEDSNQVRQLMFIFNVGANDMNTAVVGFDNIIAEIEISPDGVDSSYPSQGGSTPLWTEKRILLDPDFENRMVAINVTASELNGQYDSTTYPNAKIRARLSWPGADGSGASGTIYNSFMFIGETLRYGLAGRTNDALKAEMSGNGWQLPVNESQSELFLKAY